MHCQKATLHLLGMALKQAKPQSSSSARGKGNFLTPNRTRAHPGSTTQQSSSLPFAAGGAVLQAPFLSLSAGLGLGAGPAGETPLLIQREAGRDFRKASENYSISSDLRVFLLAPACAGFPSAA